MYIVMDIQILWKAEKLLALWGLSAFEEKLYCVELVGFERLGTM